MNTSDDSNLPVHGDAIDDFSEPVDCTVWASVGPTSNPQSHIRSGPAQLIHTAPPSSFTSLHFREKPARRRSTLRTETNREHRRDQRRMVAMAAETTKRIETYEEFANVHALLLAASGLPESLHRRLFQKLSAETFDGGDHFQIEPVEEGRMRRLVLTSDSMPKDSNIFLIDHAWTFRLSDAYKQVLTFFF